MKPEQLTLARELLQLTQQQLAQVLDVHPRTVSKWERGQLQPSPLRLAILSGVLHQQSRESDPRTVGQTIRAHLDTGDLLRAHVALGVYAYR